MGLHVTGRTSQLLLPSASAAERTQPSDKFLEIDCATATVYEQGTNPAITPRSAPYANEEKGKGGERGKGKVPVGGVKVEQRRTLRRIWRSSATPMGCLQSAGSAGTRCGLLIQTHHCGVHACTTRRTPWRGRKHIIVRVSHFQGRGQEGPAGKHLSSFMKRFFSRSSSLALTAHTHTYTHSTHTAHDAKRSGTGSV